MTFIYQRTISLLLFILIYQGLSAQRKMEKLSRGIVATRTATSKVLVSWRLLGTEAQDIGFNIYRSANGGTFTKLNSTVLTAGTNFEDTSLNLTVPNTYTVKPVINSIEKEAEGSFTLPANTAINAYYKIPIRKIDGYVVGHIFPGDIDGDGEFDFVLHKLPDATVSGSQNLPGLVEAYKRDGTLLWTINMGVNSLNRNNVTPGSSALECGHGDNWTVYDINNDGKAEVILRTSNGVTFADNSMVNDSDNSRQYISIINGQTGVEISRTVINNPYLSRGPLNGHMGIAYLDGINPSVILMGANRNADSSFNEFITAWDWTGSTLQTKWVFDLTGKKIPSGHQIKIFDIDGDGKDEIFPQAFAIDDDGTLMYNLLDQAIDHGDRFAISDLDPLRPGLELYGVQQGNSQLGILWYYCDAKTGKLLTSKSDPRNIDVGAGMVVDVDPRYIGLEMQAFRENFYNLLGNEISTARPSVTPSQRLWWDGDIAGEILSDNGKIVKWNPLINKDTRLYTAITTAGAVESSVPSFYGDIIGDWREEVIYETTDHNNLVVLTSPNSTTIRLYTMPHNPGYRNDMCLKGYYQSNNPDYFVGYDMQQPPLPPIQNATEYWVGNTSTWDKNLSNWSNGINPRSFADGDTVMFDIRGNNADTVRLTQDVSPARIWAINPAQKDYTIAGTGKLTGSMDLWKSKGGSLTLKGNHTYTGATFITEGLFNLDGTIQSQVNVRGLGAIGGRGNLAGGILIDKGISTKGGRIAPGFGSTSDLLGSLRITGNLNINGNNNFEFDVAPGSLKRNDSLIVLGNLNITGTNRLNIHFADDNFIPGTYTIIKCNGTLTASLSNFNLEGIAGVSKDLLIENNEVKIRINQQRSAGQVVWSSFSDNKWDFDSKNFKLNTEHVAFVSKDTVTFDNSASLKTVALNETVYPASVTFNSDSTYNIHGNGSIAGNTGITKSSTGALNILNINNSYTGKTIINGGNLAVSKIGLKNEASSLGAAGAAPENIQLNDVNLKINNTSITDRAISLSGNNTINIPDSTAYAIFVGDITGSGSVTKEGKGSVYMIGSKSFSGSVVIKSGQVNLRGIVGNDGGLGTSKNITLENAILTMDDLEEYSNPAWNLNIPEGKSAKFIPHGRSNMTGALTGAGTLTIETPYIRTNYFGNWSAFTGKIISVQNHFRIGNTFGYSNAAIHLAGGSLYTVSGASSSMPIGELSGLAGTTVTSDLSSANWTIGSKNTDATFSGNITKSALTKVGTGTFTVDGNNTYAGNTAINAGRLLVNNAAGKRGIGAGSVTVASGAILGGMGGIKGVLAVNSGGSVQPGSNGIGTLTDSTSVTFASGSIAEMEINKSGTSTTFDVLKVTGGLTFNGKLVVGKLGTTAFAPGDNFKLFDATSYTGNFTSIEPQAPGPDLTWQFTPATGTLSVVGTATPQTITFSPIGNKFVGDNDFNPGATASSGLPVTYTSSDPTVATIVNGQVHILSAGSTTITASQEGDATYLAATSVNQVLSVNKKAQTITFTALPQKVRGDADFDLSATSTSGLTIGYSSSNSSVATVTNGVVHIIGTGSTTITASQEGDAMYLAATPVSQLLTVTKKSQNITFSTLPQKMTGDADFTLSATSTSGLAPSYSSSNTAVATVTNGVVRIVGAGSTTITASHAGDAMYSAAPPVEQTLVIVAAPSIFTLPAKNFKISATDETCASSNNGKIRIEATAAFNYWVKLNESGTEYSLTSSAPLEIPNLEAGNHEVCITVDGQANYKFCAPQVRITEPAALSVYSSVSTSDKTVYLSLAGGNSYEVELNGQSYKTSSNTLTLNLAEGKNDLVVRTDKECQGVFTKSVVLDSNKLIYPNPFDGTLFINLAGNISKTAKLSIFSFTGLEVYSKEHILSSGDIELNLSSLTPGTYILKIKTAQSESSSQIIKK